ncbi:MAG: class I SAM-dependent methyltransferase [bacterium]
MSRSIPWQVIFAVKIAMTKLPVRRAVWRRLGWFRPGAMDRPEYADRVFAKHFGMVDFPRKSGGFVQMELGPGDSLFSALSARARGAAASYLVDVGDFATADVAAYRAMAEFLKQKGFTVPDIQGAETRDEILKVCNAQYLTQGLASLRALESESVDFIWSHAVLEFVRKAELPETLRELRRVLRPGGACSHVTGFQGVLGGDMNCLRFSEKFWESDLIAQSGFYSNRIMCSEMMEMFQQAGFSARPLNVARWDKPRLPRSKLAKPFRDLPDEEMCICAVDIILT